MPKTPLALPKFLDPHQIDGVKWILSRQASYLAHAPGAGKTVQAITAAMLTPGRGCVVFVVPPSLTANWVREIEKFYDLISTDPHAWPTISVVPTTARKNEMNWGADFIIVPDSMLAKLWVLEKLRELKIKFVAVDEASRFKESRAERTVALFGGMLDNRDIISGVVHDCAHAVLLDGSPMPNRPMELWAPTYALAPHAINNTSQQDFGFRYCGARMNDFGQWEFKGASKQEELKARLTKSFMHVVSEDKLGHPERRRSMLVMSKDVRSFEQKTWEKKNLAVLKLSDISEEKSQGELARFRRELGLKKVPWIADYVAERLSTKNESILLFAWHREVVTELWERLRKYRPALVMGGTSEAAREGSFGQFQKGKLKLIIGNIGAMGRGHNLQRADRVVFGEFSWTDETNKQCEKRTSRKGNDRLFTRCDYITCPGSMDEMILKAVFAKAENVKRIIG